MDVAELDLGGGGLGRDEDGKSDKTGDGEGYGREEAEYVLESNEGGMHCGGGNALESCLEEALRLEVEG